MHQARFYFRLWLTPEEEPEIEIMFKGLIDTDSTGPTIEDLIAEIFLGRDLHTWLKLEKDKYWQAWGEAVLRFPEDGETQVEKACLQILEFDKGWFVPTDKGEACGSSE